MAIALLQGNSMTPTPAPQPSPQTQQQQSPSPALRRATYVHVSDLTSAYNIDHAKLEEELLRVRTQVAEQGLSDSGEHGAVVSSVVSPSAKSSTPVAAGSETVISDLESTTSSLPPMQQKRLQPPRGGYNLCVLVGKVNLVVDKQRVDRSRVRLAEVEVGDETGMVSLRARDDQIDTLEDVSRSRGALVLRNCTLELYQGKHIRLAVTKWGKLSVYPDQVASTPPPPSKMNSDRNFSLIDLSVVASEMVDTPQEAGYSSRKGSDSPDERGGSRGQTKTGSHKQNHSSHRRNSRDRRGPQRGKGGGAQHQMHYSAPHDAAMLQPGDQMRYGMPYANYDQRAIDSNSFPYGHNVQTDQARQQMMVQQYQMQQHMYHRHHQQQQQQQETHSSHQQQLHLLGPQGSFDTSSEFGSQARSAAPESHVFGTNRGMMGLPGHTVDRYMQGASPSQSSPGRGQSEGNAQFYNASNIDDSPFSPGRMNPEASSYAPAYMNPSVNTSGSPQVYFPYDPSAGGNYHQGQQPFYSHQGMYIRPPRPSSASPSLEHSTAAREVGKVQKAQDKEHMGPPRD